MKPMEPYALRMALEVLARDPGVEKVKIFDFEESHVTFAAGRYSWHRPKVTIETGAIDSTLIELLTVSSDCAHFQIDHYPKPIRWAIHDSAPFCERSCRE